MESSKHLPLSVTQEATGGLVSPKQEKRHKMLEKGEQIHEKGGSDFHDDGERDHGKIAIH